MKFKKLFLIILMPFLMTSNKVSAEFNWWRNLKNYCKKIKIFNRKKYITEKKATNLINNIESDIRFLYVSNRLNLDIFSAINDRLRRLENLNRPITKINGYISSSLKRITNTIRPYTSTAASVAVASITSYFVSRALTHLFENKDIYTRHKPNQIKKNEIIGQVKAKKEIKTIINQKKNPEIYDQLKANTTKRILLYGTHGNGRTILVKNLAKESNTVLYELNATSLQSKWVSGSAERIKKLFSDAQRENNGCIIYIKNIDIFDENLEIKSQNKIDKDIISQLCDEIKKEKNNKIIFIASTNTNPNNINKELRKSFNKVINMQTPKELDIKEMLKKELPKNICSDDLDYENIIINNINTFESVKRIADKAKEIAASKAIKAKTISTAKENPKKWLKDTKNDTRFMTNIENYETNKENLPIRTFDDVKLKNKILYFKYLKKNEGNASKDNPRVSKADLESAIKTIRQENMEQARKNINQF